MQVFSVRLAAQAVQANIDFQSAMCRLSSPLDTSCRQAERGRGAYRIWAARFSMLRALPELRSALMPVCELL